VVQDVKERIASRTYTKKKRFLNVCLGGGVTRVVAFFISVSGDVGVILVRGVYICIILLNPFRQRLFWAG